MHLHYLEIVTHDVDAVCASYEAVHAVQFSQPEPSLGGARVARLDSGGRVGVRAPLRPTEEPVVRPYLRVPDIEAAVRRFAAQGGEVAHEPLEIPGHGTFAILLQGGNEHGLWQV